jgi:RNA polymerase sigma-70 factor (ECF subfamily)
VKSGQAPQPRRATRTDDVLLLQIAQGDLEALGDLYDRHAANMWRAVARVLGSRTDARDVVHNVFLKLPTIARAYDGRADARSWLIGIAVRTSLRHRRSAGRFLRMLTSLAHSTIAPRAGSPEDIAVRGQELSRFESIFRKLSPKKRAIFTLVEIEGMTTEEASQALRIPSATARTRLHHARRELQHAMKRRGDE